MKTITVESTFLKGMDHGWGNGYVLIPKGHSYHGVKYENIPVNVHGGLTFGMLVTEDALTYFPGLSKEDIGCWMVGFDTAHYQDTSRNFPKERVEKETENLKWQLEQYAAV